MASPRALFLDLPLVAFGVIIACSNQGEGERCDTQNGILAGANDCTDNLICVDADQLAGDGDRCCPPPEQISATTDSRCRPSNSQGTGGSAGLGGESPAAEAGQAGAAPTVGTEIGGSVAALGGSAGATSRGSGAPCAFSSDCLNGNEVCGPGGRCQWQCLTDKDCPAASGCDGDTHTCLPLGAATTGGVGG